MPATDTVNFSRDIEDMEERNRIMALLGYSRLWYSKQDTAMFWSPSALGNVKTISANDTPGTAVPVTYDHGVTVGEDDDIVDRIEAEIFFQLDVSALTVDRRHGGRFLDKLTREWTVAWHVNLSGTIAQDGPTYVWTPDEVAGVYVNGSWSRAPAGSRPVETDSTANFMLAPAAADFKDVP